MAFGRLIADRIRGDPERWITHTRGNLARWLTTCSPRGWSTLLGWDAALLDGPAAALALLTGTDGRAVRLRQSNPFVGTLTNSERNAAL